MATVITEKLRNPNSSPSWITTRRVDQESDGFVVREVKTATDGTETLAAVQSPLVMKNGILQTEDIKTALNNIGISWGTEEAPATGTPNSIYIQLNG